VVVEDKPQHMTEKWERNREIIFYICPEVANEITGLVGEFLCHQRAPGEEDE